MVSGEGRLAEWPEAVKKLSLAKLSWSRTVIALSWAVVPVALVASLSMSGSLKNRRAGLFYFTVRSSLLTVGLFCLRLNSAWFATGEHWTG